MIRKYLQLRMQNSEDRFMKFYGAQSWEANNMELVLRCHPNDDDNLKEAFLNGARALLKDKDHWFYEEGVNKNGEFEFFKRDTLHLKDLLVPRNGIYFDLKRKGEITIIWNHLQMDGVLIWRAVRSIFDDNPPLLQYQETKVPPPFLPEVLGLTRFAKQLFSNAGLQRHQGPLSKRLFLCKTARIRALKKQYTTTFNAATTAVILEALFQRHPEAKYLQIGLSVYFPYLHSRNRYGLVVIRVQRAKLDSIIIQLTEALENPHSVWGVSSLQSLSLLAVPDRYFLRCVQFLRSKIDVIISNLPVGVNPIEVGKIPVNLGCFTKELTVPYYFLIMGTKEELHISFSSQYQQSEGELHFENLFT